jgi:F-type H+-transporting ATPase subunit epsilon
VAVNNLRLEVLTPEGSIFDAEVDAVVVPLPDGWQGILPGHLAFQARLMRGEVLFRAGGNERTLATLGGTMMVQRGTVTILTGTAALDHTLEALEHEISGKAQRLAEMEREAEKHFDRVYRQMARTFTPRRGRHV